MIIIVMEFVITSNELLRIISKKNNTAKCKNTNEMNPKIDQFKMMDKNAILAGK